MILKKKLMTAIAAYFCVLLTPAQAGYQFYGDNFDSGKWRSSGNRLECRLTQTIPGYGEATFRHHSLEPMEFRVSADYVPRKVGQALLFVSPPDWKPYADRKILGRVPLNAQKDILVIPEDWAYRMALELREGMEAVWSHSDWADGEDIVTAKVTPILFESAWRDFQQCGQQLINYGYKDVRFTSFYFSKMSLRLNLSEKAQLDKLAEYVLLDEDYQYIKINSHTDSRGVRGKNLAISKKRANMVKKYLVDKGVNPKRFVIVAQGEKGPKCNNRTKSGRAKNRRVEVLLVK
jgi:outer membrane protein OmpA-like peptidoglycan-associated protein